MRSQIRPPPVRIARILSLGRRTVAAPFRSLRRPDEPGKKSAYSVGSSSWSESSCSSWGGQQIIRVAWRSGGGLGSWGSPVCGLVEPVPGGITADQDGSEYCQRFSLSFHKSAAARLSRQRTHHFGAY